MEHLLEQKEYQWDRQRNGSAGMIQLFRKAYEANAG